MVLQFITRSGRKDVFKAHLKSIITDVQFTMEEEKDGALPFLDVLVRRRDDGELTTSKCSPTKTTIRRHTKEATSKPYSNEWRHTAAYQKLNKKNSVTSNDNGYPSSFFQKTLR